MSTNQRIHRLLLAAALTVGCLAILVQSKAAINKRASESLYDNIYEAISDFTEEELNNPDLPAIKRSSRQSGQFNRALAPQANQAPRGGRQAGTRKVIVDGFPTGLPDGTPRGVQIALASMVDTGEMPPIPGQAGVDYPTYTTVPDTGFDCNAQTFPGIYGDPGADCQTFWMCQPNGNFNGFLCPNGTIFNQEYFICDWWYNFDCGNIENFYGLNEFIYQDQPEGFQFAGGDNALDNGLDANDGFAGNGNQLSGNGNGFSGGNSFGGGNAASSSGSANVGNFGRGSGGGGNRGNSGGNRGNSGGNSGGSSGGFSGGNSGGNRNRNNNRNNNNNGGGALAAYGAPGK